MQSSHEFMLNFVRVEKISLFRGRCCGRHGGHGGIGLQGLTNNTRTSDSRLLSCEGKRSMQDLPHAVCSSSCRMVSRRHLTVSPGRFDAQAGEIV
jgi:hypothetical protein